MKLGTHMQIMDIGSLGIKNVLNNLGCRREYTSTAATRMQSTRHMHNQPYLVIEHNKIYKCLHIYSPHKVHTVFLQSDAAASIFIAAHFCAATIRGRHLFLWEAHRHQRWLDKVCTSETVARHCQ